ncbi:MAG: hypothetical protein MO853_08615 [Candidatus Protistobacter heckmanni]|nr:hypothetical protein [Candidatus Protistobacter heckmanni]
MSSTAFAVRAAPDKNKHRAAVDGRRGHTAKEPGGDKMMDSLRRQHFIADIGAAAAAVALGELADRRHRPRHVPKLESAVSETARRERRPNILMPVSDQERSIRDLPNGLGLHGHEKLMEKGVTLDQYHANTTPCSPSRSNMYFR